MGSQLFATNGKMLGSFYSGGGAIMRSSDRYAVLNRKGVVINNPLPMWFDRFFPDAEKPHNR